MHAGNLGFLLINEVERTLDVHVSWLRMSLEAYCNSLRTLQFFCSIFRPYMYLKEYNPQTARRKLVEHSFKIPQRELKKYYVIYFSLTPEAKRCLAASLGITPPSLRKWMLRKRQKDQNLQRSKNQLRTPCNQNHGIHIAGIYMYASILLVLLILTQFK